MKAILDKEFTETDLEPTPGIDATIFSLGSGHDWVTDKDANKQPATGEDVYTIIHQSLINCCSALALTYGLEKIEQPIILQNIASQFDTIFNRFTSDRFQPKTLIGLNINQQKITTYYNLPLGQHSLQIYLDYFLKTKKTTITLDFFGGTEDEAYRWINVAILATRYRTSDFLKINIKKLHTHAVSIVISDIENDITMLSHFLSQLPALIKTTAQDVFPTIELFQNNPLTKEQIQNGLNILKTTGNLGVLSTIKFSIILVEKKEIEAFSIATTAAYIGYPVRSEHEIK
jgi:hypothetical protein